MTAISKAEFARQQNLSRARVSQYISSGILRDSILPSGRLDLDVAKRELASKRDALRRLEYDLCADRGNSTPCIYPGDPDGPPEPFTGNIIRDFMIMSLISLYDYFLQEMVPLQLKLLRELHVEERTAKGMAICFSFKTHDIFKNFVEKDLFKKFLSKEIGEDIDSIPVHSMRARKVKTFPPEDFKLYHPKVVLDLLKDIGPDWPFDDDHKMKKVKKGDGGKKDK
jgi:hypothetical protein